MPQHRAERHDARAAGEEEQRAAGRGLPDEVAADRAAQLELVAGTELVDEVGRDLAVVEPLDGQDEVLVLRGRGDRVAALGLVAVLGRQPDVDVLTREMAVPVGRIEDDAAHVGRLVEDLDHACGLPGQSPA